MSERAIEVMELRRSYGYVEAVRGIDLSVEEGEVFALLGQNGAGKTTVIEILEGFRAPTSGHVQVLGLDPQRAGQRLRRQVGVVLQEAAVEPYLTVREALARNAGYYPDPLPVGEVIERVGLAEKADARVKTLSGGQQRRLDVALGIIGQPRLLFLDAPTTGFDPSARRGAWDLVRSLRDGGTTIVLTTHDMDEAQALADRLAVMTAGRIVASGSPQHIGGRDSAAARIRFVTPADVVLEKLPVIAEPDGPGRAVISTDDPTRALHLLTGWMIQRGLRLEGLSVDQPSLEGVYLELTTRLTTSRCQDGAVPDAGLPPLHVGVGPASLAAADLLLDIGPQHPSTHGSLRLSLTLDGEHIIAAEPVVGYLHRGAEKLFEVRDYRQITVLANRHDWLSAFSNEIGVVTAVERMLGLEVPVRATWLRTLIAELNRVLCHLMFLGAAPVRAGTALPDPASFAAREALQGLLEDVSGGRMHYMFNRVGGLKEEVPAGWTEHARQVVGQVRSGLPALTGLIHDEDFRSRTTGLGVLGAAQVLAYGVSGPVARASGVSLDLRRDEPYLAYGELDVRLVTRSAGDCLARFDLLLDQVAGSLDLAEACLQRLAGLAGPVNVRLPKVVKAPEGALYVWTENPLGIMGYYLVSHGERTPWRLHMRTASYNNVQVLRELAPGLLVSDLPVLLASLFFIVGDIDK